MKDFGIYRARLQKARHALLSLSLTLDTTDRASEAEDALL